MHERQTLHIDGMDCPSCAGKIEGVVSRIPGISNIDLNYNSQKLKFDSRKNSRANRLVVEAVEKLGYKTSRPQDKADSKELSWYRTGKGHLVIFVALLLAIAAVMSFALPAYAGYIYATAALTALFPLARKAVSGAMAGQPFSIETLVTIAVIGAIFIDEAAEAAVVVFLFLIGELLEMMAASKARRSVQALADLVPKSAFLVTPDGIEKVDADSLKIGDVIEVKPGGRVPADGRIIKGQTSIDEAAVTGESIPKRKQKGDSVFAGSINADSLIRLEVVKSAENNMISRILQMVEDAEASKAPTARFIDRFSRYYTPGVIVVSALIAFLPPLLTGAELIPWVYKGLAILLIGCPCALVLSTPAAITSGISSGARHGLLMKGGAILEAIGTVRQIAFDKTGTLTRGKPEVTDIVTFSKDRQQLLQLAGAVEAGSSHPLATAIVREVKKRGIAIPEASGSEALNGRGVRAMVDGQTITVASPRFANEMTDLTNDQNAAIEALEDEGKTIAVVLMDTTALGIIALRDELRKDARKAMKKLSDIDVSAIMLTGDNRRTGKALAAQLGIEVKAELMPADKLKEIEALKTRGAIAMVGDGINDAPALARADVGIAMGGGTDVALETADAAILHERISDIPSLVELSRATMHNIYQNISIALGLKAVFLVTTLLGVTTLWMAILADTGATVLVTLNALRLLRHKFEQ